MSNKWDFSLIKENLVNQKTGEPTNFYGLFRDDNHELVHIGGRGMSDRSFKQVFKFFTRKENLSVFNEHFSDFHLKEEDIHIIRESKVAVFKIVCENRYFIDFSEYIDFCITVIDSIDGSNRQQAHVQPVHRLTGIFLPSMEIKQFSYFVERGDVKSFISAYSDVISRICDTYYSLMSYDFGPESEEPSVFLSKFFEVSSDSTRPKSDTRKRNRFNDVISSYKESTWPFEKTRYSLWRLYLELQGKDQFSWCRDAGAGENFFSNTFGLTQKNSRAVFDKFKEYSKK